MFCQNCGKVLAEQAVFCPNCGQPTRPVASQPPPQYVPVQPQPPPQYVPVQPQYQQPPPPVQQPVSGWYYLLPFFFLLIGGIIGYLIVKDRNKGMANNLLIFGLVWTVVAVIFWYFVFYLILLSLFFP